MSLTKNIVLAVTNEKEGITLVIKTVAQMDRGVVISGDPGLYDIEEVKAAINEADKFINEKKESPPEGGV